MKKILFLFLLSIFALSGSSQVMQMYYPITDSTMVFGRTLPQYQVIYDKTLKRWCVIDVAVTDKNKKLSNSTYSVLNTVGTTYSAGTGLTLSTTTFSHTAHTGDATGATSLTVVSLRGRSISTITPSTNSILTYDGTYWKPTNTTPLDSATGNIARQGSFLDTLFTSRLLSKRIGLNTLTTNTKLDVFGTNALGKDMFNFVDKTINVQTTTLANAIDTSSFYLYYTSTGKPMLTLRNGSTNSATVTNKVFNIDSTGNFSFNIGNATNTRKFYTFGLANIYQNTEYTPIVIMNTNGASPSTGGGMLTLGRHSGAAMVQNTRLGYLGFFGSFGSAVDNSFMSTRIECYAEGTWSGIADCGAFLRFLTCPDGSGTGVPRIDILGSGITKFYNNINEYDSLVVRKESSTMQNNGIIALAAGQAGFGSVVMVLTSSGAAIEWADFVFSEDGTVLLKANSTNVSTTGATPASLNIYDAGTNVSIENKLGATHTIKMVINYSAN